MTDPLVPADVDLRDFHYMPLDIGRLLNSDLVAVASGEEFRAAVMLWCRSWHQVPAASLPNDDRMLAHLAGFGRDLKAWSAIKPVALRGFVICSDGRLYHPVIAEKAIEAMDAKRRQRDRTAKATQARKQPSRSPQRSRNDDRNDARNGERGVAPEVQRNDDRNDARDDDRNDARDDDRNDARNVHQGRGRGIGIGNSSNRIASTRASADTLEAQLREAAGWQSDPSPNLFVTGPIQALIDNGGDLHLDVLPVVKALAPRCKGRKNWNYFTAAIAEARHRRIEAATIVSPSSDNRRPTHAAREQKPSRDETFAAIDRRIDELERQQAESGAIAAGD